MKKIFYLSVLTFMTLFLITSCSDDDDPYYPPAEVNPEVEKVIDALKDIDGVSQFTKALADNALNIRVDDNITVFAIKDEAPAQKSTSDESSANLNVLKRHIVEGKIDLTGFAVDSLIVNSISGEPVAITKAEDKIYINGVLFSQVTPTPAGDNIIYVIEETAPEVELPAHKSTFSIYEINESWAAEAPEKALADSVKIEFFRFVDGQYVNVGIAYTNKGEAVYDHYYADNLFCTVSKSTKSTLREGYTVAGLFTTQEQIDQAPTYSTGTYLDNIELGSLRLADSNGDNTINETDKPANEYIAVSSGDSKNEHVIVSPEYGKEPEQGQ